MILALDWLQRHSLPVSELEEPDVLRRGLDALCRKVDGTAAAAKTVMRRKAAVNEVFGAAAIKALPGRGPHLFAFFGCMYYAAMRPAEVIRLQNLSVACRRVAGGFSISRAGS
ncbi:hypothetical protein [Streptomyces benahoarensis]|uniref:hypothetical protein n=1 Tax=Streptomyces benahoarensis TaxID=2595054 RepID=UPI002034E637|nr:hypothetical protein [Streptomyces benahoarensis]